MKKYAISYLIISSLLFGLSFHGVEAASFEDKVVINEIMFNPSSVSDSRGEWFELYNSSENEIDLYGWTFTDGNYDSFTIDEELSIKPDGYLVLGRNASEDLNGGVSIDYKYTGMYLSNSDDAIIVYDGCNVLVDSVTYSKGNDFPYRAGYSMELVNPGFDNIYGGNWALSSSTYGDGDIGTPGRVNSCSRFPEIDSGSFPLMAFKMVFHVDSFCGWVSDIQAQEAQGHYEGHTEGESDLNLGETHDNESNPRVLFCENKGQYYDHKKASVLFSMLEESGYDVDVFSEGDITGDVLRGHDLVIITNPSKMFHDQEIASIDGYLSDGGRIVLSGQYFKYLNEGALNQISSVHGIEFTDTEVLDDDCNTGKPYYPKLIFDFDDALWHEGVMEIHYANCCNLHVVDGKKLIGFSDSAYVIGPDGKQLAEVPCFAAVSSDGKVLCFSSSTVLTTSLYRADNKELIRSLFTSFLLRDT